MRINWKYLEVLGGILTLFGTLALLPGCPYFLLFAYGPCSLSSLAGETGFVIVAAGTLLIIVGEFGRRGKKPVTQPTLNSPTVVDEQDILRIAKELIEQLSISSFRPVSVSWAEEVPLTMPDSENIPPGSLMIGREVPIGWCIFTWDRVVLPTEMRGKLDPEEWRPLLTSSLIYEAKLRKKRYLETMLISTPIIIDLLGWWELFAVSTPASGIPALLLILDIVWLFPAFFLSRFLAKWFSRRLRLRADTLAAEHVGKKALERVLKKMETLGLVDPDAGIGWNSSSPFTSEFMNGRPTLPDRITNISQASRIADTRA